MPIISHSSHSDPKNIGREERLMHVLRIAAIRDSLPAWDNAENQLGPVTVEMINELNLPAVCAQYGSLDILSVLNYLGVDLDRANENGKTPIQIAAEEEDFEIVEFLKMSLAAKDSRVEHHSHTDNLNAPTNTCDAPDDTVLVMLLRAGADDRAIAQAWNDKHPTRGKLTSFQSVVCQGLVKTAEYYLAERRENPNQLTSRGKTLLQLAKMAGSRSAEMRETILSHRCCSRDSADETVCEKSSKSLSL